MTHQTQTILELPAVWQGAKQALTSVPWPVDRRDVPGVRGIASQAVPLFEPMGTPRLRRFLLLCAADQPLPAQAEVIAGPGDAPPAAPFSDICIHTLRENLDPKKYVHRECEARLTLAGREIALRMGLLPNHQSSIDNPQFSWWQWSRAERLWSGPVAEAWRVGGHLVPYTVDTPGQWDKRDLRALGEQIAANCGDALHGDLVVVAWKSGPVQITAHFKAGYFHYWPKPIPAFPVLYVDGRVIQPWTDLRVLANKTKDNEFVYLDPARADTIPPGVSRSFRYHLGSDVARYQVPAAWYQTCGVIETDQPGPAVEMASRSAALIREHTQREGFDAGRVWRYLRRDLRSGIPQEDGPEWEGNLAQGMFTLAYQRGESPAENWDLYLHQPTTRPTSRCITARGCSGWSAARCSRRRCRNSGLAAWSRPISKPAIRICWRLPVRWRVCTWRWNGHTSRGRAWGGTRIR